MSEVVGQRDAFIEGQREREERIRNRFPASHSVPLVGGPLDGKTYAVPVAVMRASHPFEAPIPIVSESSVLYLPGEPPKHAVYRLDRAGMRLQFMKVVSYG